MAKLYGSVTNRLEEDRMFCEKIEVGTGMTEYSWSDRHAYEVVEVRDQKHVSVREYDHIADGPCYSNQWKLVSDPSKPIRNLVKRGKYLYWASTATLDDLNRIMTIPGELFTLTMAGFNPDVIRAKGKQTKYSRAKVSFGVAEYYFDYEF